MKTLVLGVMDARCEAARKPTKNLLPGDLYLMPDGGRGIKRKFRNFFVGEVTKGTLVAAR